MKKLTISWSTWNSSSHLSKLGFSNHYHIINRFGQEENKILNSGKKVTTALVDNKYNTEISRNGYPIRMFQEKLLYELFFIAIDNQGQFIISLNKKTVATYVTGELEVLV